MLFFSSVAPAVPVVLGKGQVLTLAAVQHSGYLDSARHDRTSGSCRSLLPEKLFELSFIWWERLRHLIKKFPVITWISLPDCTRHTYGLRIATGISFEAGPGLSSGFCLGNMSRASQANAEKADFLPKLCGAETMGGKEDIPQVPSPQVCNPKWQDGTEEHISLCGCRGYREANLTFRSIGTSLCCWCLKSI